jgi:hypothetical protein
MPAKPPTKAPDATPDKPVENKFDPFHPDMPQIPGVSQAARQSARASGGLDTQRLLQIGGVAVALLLIGSAILWRVKSKPRGAGNDPSDAEVVDQNVPAPPLPNLVAADQEGPTVAAKVDELSKPWDAKKFTYVKIITQEHIEAMLIRLPGGELWAFSLQGPFGHCTLDYITDLGAIATQYKYNASHPMVVNPCDGTVYDPLKVGSLGGNTWVRGEIVKGSSLRPPISIDVKVRGRSIIADSIE